MNRDTVSGILERPGIDRRYPLDQKSRSGQGPGAVFFGWL